MSKVGTGPLVQIPQCDLPINKSEGEIQHSFKKKVPTRISYRKYDMFTKKTNLARSAASCVVGARRIQDLRVES